MSESLGSAVLDIEGNLIPLKRDLLAGRTMTLRELASTAAKSKKLMIGAFLGIGVAVGVGLKKIGDEFDSAYDTIQSRTGALGKDLEALKDDFRDVFGEVPDDADTVARALADVNTRLDLTGKQLQDRTKQFLTLSRVTGTDVEENIESVARAFNDWEVATGKQSKTLDGLMALSQETGISVSELASRVVQFGAPLRNFGFTLDQAAAMFAGFEKAGVNMTTTMAGIRLGVGNLADPTEDLTKRLRKLGLATAEPQEQFLGIISAMEKAQTRQEALGIAIDVFGRRAANDMAEAVEQGRFKVEDLIKTFRNGKGSIDAAGEESIDAAEKFQILRNRGMLLLEPAAMAVFDALTMVADGALKVTEAISGLPGPTKAALAALLAMSVALRVLPMRAAAAGVANLATNFSLAAKEGGLLRATGNMLALAFRAHPILTIAGGVLTATGAVAGLTGAFDKLFGSQKKLSPLQRRLKETSENLSDALGRQKSALGALQDSSARVRRAHDRERQATQNVRAAEERLKEVRAKYPANAKPVLKAQADLLEAKRKEHRATKRLERAEREHGIVRQAAKPAIIAALKAERDRSSALRSERKELKDTLRQQVRYKASGEEIRKTLDRLSANSKELARARKAEANTLKEAAQRIGPRFAKSIDQMTRSELHLGREVKNTASLLKNPYKGSIFDAIAHTEKFRKKTGDTSRDTISAYGGMVNQTGKGLGILGENTNSALSGLGLQKKLQFSIKKFQRNAARRQAGGGIPIPGFGTGDKVPVSVGGVPVALTEPGEDLFILNRNAAAKRRALEQENANTPRFQHGGYVDLWGRGMAHLARGGGLEFALGPYDIPPIKFAADHAGGNSHVHITGTTTPWVVGIGRQLQRMGFTVSEHPAFGGVNAQHSPTGGHYDARAIDVNSAADETRAEVAQIARLLGGAGGGGAAIAEKIARVILQGPEGPLRDVGQAALDKVRKAANQYVSEQMGSMSIDTRGGGALSPSEFLRLAHRAIAITSRSAAHGRFNPSSFSAQGLLTLAKAESSLVPSSINNWDSNAAAGNPSGGLMHLTQSNMKAYAEPGLGSDMFNPLASIAASINYQLDRYGGQVTHSPYMRGGLIQLLARGGFIRGLPKVKMPEKPERPEKPKRRKGESKKDFEARKKAFERQSKAHKKRMEDWKKLRKKRSRKRRKARRRVSRKGAFPGISDKIAELEQEATKMEDHIARREAIYGLPTSEDAEELSGDPKDGTGEVGDLIRRNQALLMHYLKERNVVIDAVAKVGGWTKRRDKQLQALRKARRKSRPPKPRKRKGESNRAYTARLREWRRATATWERQGFLMEAVKESRDAGQGKLEEFESVLSELHGHGSPDKKIGSVPPLGALGGRIHDVQITLAQLRAPKTSETVEPQALSIEGLREFAEAAFDLNAFRRQPFDLPVFHSGGIVNAGTREVIAKLADGEGVIDAETMQRGLGGGGPREGRFTITNWREGTGYFEEVADERISERGRQARTLSKVASTRRGS